MNDAPRTRDDTYYDLGERVGKGQLSFRCKQQEEYYMYKRPFMDGYLRGRKEKYEEELHSTSAMQREDNMQKCKHCGSDKLYLKKNAMHVEVRCEACGKWNKFVGKQEQEHMMMRGIKIKS